MTRHGGIRAVPGNGTDWVIPTALALLAGQLAFRGWAAWSSWYFLDDLVLLRYAEHASQWAYLAEPYAGHLLPGGKLVLWAIGSTGSAQWWPAAVFLVATQALAGAACLWMLVTLFGRRWGILPPFAMFLFLPLSMSAYMWLSAAILYLPLQVSLALGVGAWVRYLRGRQLRWLAATLASVVLGLIFWQKAIVLLPLLGFLSLAYFSVGGIADRGRDLRRQVVGLIALCAVVGGYLAYYFTNVPSQFSSVTSRLAGQLADTLLGTTLISGLVGGPWRWEDRASPNTYADPPGWAVSAAWVVVFAVVVYAMLRRRRAGRAWLLLGGYVLGTYLLVVGSRATAFGAVLGTDSRYLSDIPVILALCLGLAFLELPGAGGSSEDREPPLVVRAPPPLVGLLIAIVLGGSIASSLAYVRPWHENNAARAFFQRFETDVSARGRIDLADRAVPEEVMSQFFAPRNQVSFLAPIVTDLAHFPPVTPDLAIVDDDGSLRRAVVERGVDSKPGPAKGCGWRVTDEGLDVPLRGEAFDFAWWMHIGYLSSADSPVTVSAGRSSADTTVRRGLNDLYLQLDGTFSEVRIDGLDPGTTLCVDVIEVGQTEPGGPLP